MLGMCLQGPSFHCCVDFPRSQIFHLSGNNKGSLHLLHNLISLVNTRHSQPDIQIFQVFTYFVPKFQFHSISESCYNPTPVQHRAKEVLLTKRCIHTNLISPRIHFEFFDHYYDLSMAFHMKGNLKDIL